MASGRANRASAALLPQSVVDDAISELVEKSIRRKIERNWRRWRGRSVGAMRRLSGNQVIVKATNPSDGRQAKLCAIGILP